ncbi:MAG: septum formation protein Maf [Bacteroidales bacterium]|nr:septum formation protein Maf [Candidatus Cacconaster merdequi]
MFEDYKITLSSASPRRKELLAALDVDFTVEVAKDEKEVFSDDIPTHLIPEYIALHKSNSFHRPLEENEILITADTLVFVRGEITGKPKDREDAVRMLRLISGVTHQVVTGVVLRTKDNLISFSDTTDVTVRDLSDSEIDYYVDRYHPYDKAGAYGVQEWIGHAAITAINGSYFNVMGLPVHHLYEELLYLTSQMKKNH